LSEAAAAGRGGQAVSEPPRAVDPLARAVFVVLVFACFVAFFVTQRLKHTPTAVTGFHATPFFSPTPSGHQKEEAISFKLANSERIAVQVLSTDGDVVATLVHDHPVERYKVLSLRWNGRRGVARSFSHTTTPHGQPVLVPHNRGRPAPEGEYRIRVQREHGRAILAPDNFTLVRR
jgi:hypothetical protein